MIEIGCLLDKSVVEAEEVKGSKYTELSNQLHRVFQRTTTAVPIVIGNTGVVSEKCKKGAEKISSGVELRQLQKIATRETVKIAKNLTCIGGGKGRIQNFQKNQK